MLIIYFPGAKVHKILTVYRKALCPAYVTSRKVTYHRNKQDKDLITSLPLEPILEFWESAFQKT